MQALLNLLDTVAVAYDGFHVADAHTLDKSLAWDDLVTKTQRLRRALREAGISEHYGFAFQVRRALAATACLPEETR